MQTTEAARPQTRYQPPTGVEGFIPGVTPYRFEPRSSGNVPQGTTINIPTLEALQQQYPYLTSPLAAQGLQPLTPRYTAYGGNGVRLPTDPKIAAYISPGAVNPYYSARDSGGSSGTIQISIGTSRRKSTPRSERSRKPLGAWL